MFFVLNKEWYLYSIQLPAEFIGIVWCDLNYEKKEFSMDNIKEKVKIMNLAYKYYKENTEYLHLQYVVNRLQDLIDNNKDVTLIVGSSYSRNAIDPTFFKNAINCSIGGQDLYYSYILCDKMIKKGINIKTIVCFLGYYSLFHELIQQKNCQDVVLNILKPVIDDTPYNLNMSSSIYDGCRESVYKLSCEIQENRKHYYNDINQRKTLILNTVKRWADYTEEEKKKACIERAQAHNRMEKYKNSLKNNILLLNQFHQELNNRGIRFVAVIPPFSEHYIQYISRTMKDGIIAVLKEQNIEYIDFNELKIVDDNDLVDMDHLNGRGAYKLSSFLSDYLNK